MAERAWRFRFEGNRLPVPEAKECKTAREACHEAVRLSREHGGVGIIYSHDLAEQGKEGKNAS